MASALVSTVIGDGYDIFTRIWIFLRIFSTVKYCTEVMIYKLSKGMIIRTLDTKLAVP